MKNVNYSLALFKMKGGDPDCNLVRFIVVLFLFFSFSLSAFRSIAQGRTKYGMATSATENVVSVDRNGKIGSNVVTNKFGQEIVLAPFSCGSSFTKSHLVGDVAPETKIVTYGTVSTNLSGASRCWITQNLGAGNQASSVVDGSETAAGWYWQFNRKQGFKHDGSARTPSTTWNQTGDNLSSTWESAKDPCTIELGSNWRIPTATEWTDADATGWSNYNHPFGSVLKLHAAGVLNLSGGLIHRGLYGWYGTGNEIDASNNSVLVFFNSYCAVTTTPKSWGLSLRCISTNEVPTLTTAAVTVETASTAAGGGNVISEGGLAITTRGVCWSTSQFPTTANSKTTDAGSTGSFTSSLIDLVTNTVYYVRAYATNSSGTYYGNEVNFLSSWSCGTALPAVIHSAGIVAPIDKTVTYGTVSTNLSGTNKCWITKNLGADQQATAATDATEASAGWYWQFNRKQGFKNDGTTRTPGTTWITSISESSNWLPSNDPCTLQLGVGWRIPTGAEWNAAIASGGWTTYAEPFNSVLKLHNGGWLDYTGNGAIGRRGSDGYYWSSTESTNTSGTGLFFNSSVCSTGYDMSKQYGFNIRCLKD